ncbi:YbaB/EbfC family nucleoid-associated protein [Hippea alviniae]|uniref:YbaB/EbfC family nucleoid-associated protein n=1 Tax=Hippea alviniae TaxID=1279027 RepID=UPI0003B55199|nr:YbaB/EbfC family nucleoid-associated protein [Hippea alviniae]
MAAKNFGGMDLNALMAQAKKIQQQIAKTQEEAAKETVEVSVGGGMVTVKANGLGEIVGIKISKEIVDPDDIETLEDLILSGVNEAVRKAKENMEAKISALTGGLNIPGMF